MQQHYPTLNSLLLQYFDKFLKKLDIYRKIKLHQHESAFLITVWGWIYFSAFP